MKKQEEIREDLTLLISECYFKELSTCQKHLIFQPQLFLSKLFPYLHHQGVMIVKIPPRGSDLTGSCLAFLEPLIEE